MMAWMTLAGWVAGVACGADIQISKVGGSKSTLDVSGVMAAGGGAAAQFKKTLEGDLARCGYFTVSQEGGAIKVAGPVADGGSSMSFRCTVEGKGKTWLSQVYKDDSTKARKMAHKVADDILFAIKGVKGIASTRIVMIGSVGGRKDLYICDADGGSVSQLTKDGVPCITPRWSVDGSKIAYTSFKSGYPDVYVIEMASGERRRVAEFPGLNAGADFSPDGTRIALTLSKDGNPEIYVMLLRGGNPLRITRSPRAAEASPSWSPDGAKIVFVSNAPGLPNLYVGGAEGGPQKRLTVRGSENVAPDWGAAGIAYCSRREGRYTICVLDPASGSDRQVTTDGDNYEDPSWAPNGRHIAATHSAGGKTDIYMVDSDPQGDPPVRLTTMPGDWYSPAWSPK